MYIQPPDSSCGGTEKNFLLFEVPYVFVLIFSRKSRPQQKIHSSVGGAVTDVIDMRVARCYNQHV